MNNKEIWKKVTNNNMYEVSNFGNFRSLYVRKSNEKYRKINGSINSSGYKVINLTFSNGKKESRKAHRLVAEAFIDNQERKRTVNHCDGNKLNNCVKNLEWNTHSENSKHAFDTGLRSNRKTYTKKQELIIVKMYKDGERPSDISRIFNIENTTLYRILNRYYVKIDSRKPAYKNSFDERKKLKKTIFNSEKSSRQLSLELGMSEKIIGDIRNKKRWNDLDIGIDKKKSKETTSIYSFDEKIILKKHVLDNKNLKHEDIVKITNLSIKTISKIKRNLIWTEIPY